MTNTSPVPAASSTLPPLPPPQLYRARLEERLDLNAHYSEYHFELLAPQSLPALPGQYISLKISDTLYRHYSLTHRSDITHGFELLVDQSPAGPGATFLKNLSFGAQVEFLGPLGNFILHSPAATALTFIATGSGIAPLRAMLLTALQLRRDQRPLELIWGMRTEDDLFWLDDLIDLQNNFPNFTFTPTLSQPNHTWTLSSGRVTALLEAHPPAAPLTTDFYLCGRPEMIAATTTILRHQNVPAANIRFEQFPS